MFKHYAHYYDVIYADKNYQNEVFKLKNIFKKLKGESYQEFNLGHMLELGCGTGGHALHLFPFCQSYTGVDLSGEMIESFGIKLKREKLKGNLHTCNLAKDKLSLELDHSFDSCLSLFHVFSYMSSDKDIENYLNNAARYLKKDGVFIFDYWNFSGVKNLGLERRKKEFLIPGGKIIREVTPLARGLENEADIMIEIKVLSQEDVLLQTFLEKHPMRFFKVGEVEDYLRRAGLRIEFIFGEGSDDLMKAPTPFDWAATVVARSLSF